MSRRKKPDTHFPEEFVLNDLKPELLVLLLCGSRPRGSRERSTEAVSQERGRPSNSSRRALENDLFLAVEALKQIASGDMLRESAAVLGRPWEGIGGHDSEAFHWAQNYAKGALERLEAQ